MKKKIFLLVVAAVLPLLSRAGLAEPDNVLYGTIAIGTNTVTATSTNVFVEARLATNGPPIASYQMGSLPSAGNYYSLRINLENSAPFSATATQTSNTVFIVVRNSSSVAFVQQYVISSRGQFMRLDFGASGDSDNDGLPDAWELLYFGNLSMGPSSIAPNGLTVLANYVAGTNPNSVSNLFELTVALDTQGGKAISFPTTPALGIGYSGVARWYDLQYQTNLGGSWLTVPGYAGLSGNNQIVSYTDSGTNHFGWYRARVYLLPSH